MNKPQLKKIIIIVIGILLIPAARSLVSKMSSARRPVDTRIPVLVERVELKDMVQTLEYVGNLKAKTQVLVYPKVNGKVLEQVKHNGEPVVKGEGFLFLDRDETGLKFEKAPVESPMDGVVGRVFVDVGSNVTAQTPVAVVLNLDTMTVDLDIPEIYVPKMRVGQTAHLEFDAYPREQFEGKVTSISPVLNLFNRAAPVEITVDNKDHRLKSGMFARVALVIASHPQVPVAIKEAVMGKDNGAYVYVVKDEKAELRKVTLGLRSGGYVEILTGVREGEWIVVMGQQRLKDQASVKSETQNPQGELP